MAVTLKTRKPIVTIRADDLDAFPIWEFCIDEEDVEGMDETWIRPVNARQLENDAYGLTVAAEFATANGLRLNGFVGVDTADGFEVAGFGLPSPNYLWVMTPVSHADKESIATIAGASLEAVFPISFRLGVCLADERVPREGRID